MKEGNNMLVYRYNFETNSSSMHSLSVRRTSGTYTKEEVRLSEAIHNEPKFDVIITTNKDGSIWDEESLMSGMWFWQNKLHFSSYDVDFIGSPMQVLSGPRDKLKYAIASALSSDNVDGRVAEVKAAFAKILPNITLEIESGRCNIYSRGRYISGGVERDILGPFLKENNISVDEFIANQEYIVIVNYAEYTKMKNLDMVDESAIQSRYPNTEFEQGKINIVKGVWHLTENDLNFGRSPFRVLGTPEGKARYVLASTGCENIEEVTEILREIYPEIKEISRPYDPYESDGLYCGYCDDSICWHCGIGARELILDKKYVIIADGDEYCVWQDFKKTPLFNAAAYEESPTNNEED